MKGNKEKNCNSIRKNSLYVIIAHLKFASHVLHSGKQFTKRGKKKETTQTVLNYLLKISSRLHRCVKIFSKTKTKCPANRSSLNCIKTQFIFPQMSNKLCIWSWIIDWEKSIACCLKGTNIDYESQPGSCQ